MTCNMETGDIISQILSSFRLNITIKQEQKTIIDYILNKNDVFAVLTTGFGKSLIYTLIPKIQDKITGREHTALVISPLISLIKDQKDIMEKYGLSVLSTTDSKPADLRSDLSIVFATPEAATSTKWKVALQEKTNISLIVFDEAHCISSWGIDFRPEYRNMASIQSLFDVPNLALTATSTEYIQKDIFQVLSFDSEKVKVVANLPDRPNIFIDLRKSTENYEIELAWLLDHLKEEGTNKHKIVVFVNSLNKCFQLYMWLTSNLMDNIFANKVQSPTNRRIEMFHANTDSETKERILMDFSGQDGSIELLICTIAFGMGIDVKNIDLVIHWGIPKSILHYWQEIGRCGRDNRKGYAVTYSYPRSLVSVDTEIKKLAETDKCLRLNILKNFQLKGMDINQLSNLEHKQTCTKLCDKPCECDKCNCCIICKKMCSCSMNYTDSLQNFMKDI
ncbi:hypothetical protein FSP39_012764 [Pinctada imbricata]|uniref:DNA 3'-5' helicase n=1 Tax=Pinctada imbricata TaxID=66713 RepID=A0AA88YMH6_PINIB|nr:hypothetical protein FSP39_012764 [Pinctada imbricata]